MRAKLSEHDVPVKNINAGARWEKQLLAIDRATAKYLKHPESALASPVAVSPAKAQVCLASVERERE
jgi:hypothetical protein